MFILLSAFTYQLSASSDDLYQVETSVLKSFEFRVSSFKFVGRASVPANVGCALRTIESAPLFTIYGWAKGP